MKKLLSLPFFMASFLFFCILQSCYLQNDKEISEFYELGEEGMQPNLEYLFHPEFLTSGEYDVVLSIRYTGQCELESLPLQIEYSSLSSDSVYYQQKMIDFPVKDHKRDKGNFGIYQLETPSITHFNSGDGFYITLSTPATHTSGMISLGVICRKIESHETDR